MAVTVTVMGMTTTSDLPLLRLLHLVSPSLPIGGFTYSQGIEWAVDAGWLRTAADLEAWLADLLHNALARVDLPLLVRMQAAANARDPLALASAIVTVENGSRGASNVVV